jgi:hypothetical protein
MQVRSLENQVRLVARRRGLALVKSRSRAVVERHGGFMLLDGDGRIVAGGVPAAYSLRLDDVQQFLVQERRD